MGGDSKREYLAAIRQRYLQASKEEKGLILREFCEVCEYHRKHAIRLLNQRKRGRQNDLAENLSTDQESF